MNEEPKHEAPQRIQPKARRTSVKGCLVALVIAIAGVIALIGLAGGGHPGKSGKLLSAKAVMKGLEIAIKGYKTEYLRLPFVGETPPSQDNQAYDTTDANGRKLIDVLLALDTKNNPRPIRFWEPPPGKPNGAGYTSEGGLKDIWGKQGYKVILDYNGDGKITNPYGASEGEPDEINADIIIYSAGANGFFEEGGSKDGKRTDDIRSWQ